MSPIPEVVAGTLAEPVIKWGLDQLIESLKHRLKNKPNVDLDGVKRICGYLASFKSKGRTDGETYQFPPQAPTIWSTEQTTFKQIFTEWFYDADLPSDNRVSAELKEWLEKLEGADTTIWRGPSGHFDFQIEDTPVKKAAAHQTIRQMYPFVIISRIPKQGHDVDYMYDFVLLFMNGWKVFLDKHTRFESSNSLILNTMSYIEGEFFSRDVFYLDIDRNSEVSNQPLALRRHMIVSETSSSINICLTGVPYVQHRKPESPYHGHVTRWYRDFQILKD